MDIGLTVYIANETAAASRVLTMLDAAHACPGETVGTSSGDPTSSTFATFNIENGKQP